METRCKNGHQHHHLLLAAPGVADGPWLLLQVHEWRFEVLFGADCFTRGVGGGLREENFYCSVCVLQNNVEGWGTAEDCVAYGTNTSSLVSTFLYELLLAVLQGLFLFFFSPSFLPSCTNSCLPCYKNCFFLVSAFLSELLLAVLQGLCSLSLLTHLP